MRQGIHGYPIFEAGDRVFCCITFSHVTDWYLGTCLETKPGIDWDVSQIRFDQPLPDGKRERWVEEPDMRELSLLEKLADESNR